jgi:hypothetical protein
MDTGGPMKTLFDDTNGFYSSPLATLKKLDCRLYRFGESGSLQNDDIEDEVLDFEKKIEIQFRFFEVESQTHDSQFEILNFGIGSENVSEKIYFYIRNSKLYSLVERRIVILLDKASRKEKIIQRGFPRIISIDNVVPGFSRKCNKYELDSVTVYPRSSIYQQFEDHLASGKLLQVFVNHNPDGIDIKIGYNADVCKWVIGTGRSTIVTKEFNDLEQYGENPKYEIALQIAKKIEVLLLSIGANKTQGLKELLESKNCTLLGKYFDPAMQLIVPSRKPELLFQAIAQNQLDGDFIYPHETTAIFTEFSLDYQEPTEIISIKAIEDLRSTLSSLYEKTTTESCLTTGAGSILYFTDPESLKKSKVSLLAVVKIKSSEFVIFRKLKKCLKAYLNELDISPENAHYYTSSSTSVNVQTEIQTNNELSAHKQKKSPTGVSYQEQLSEFQGKVNSYKDKLKTRSCEFYNMMARIAFNFACETKRGDLIFKCFPYFLNSLFDCCEKSELLTAENYSSIFQANSRFIDWNQSFRKIEPHIKELSSGPLIRPISSGSFTFEGRFKHVKIIMPVVIIGSGKSYFFGQIKEKFIMANFVSYLITSDELAWYMIEKVKFKMNYKKGVDYFAKSRKEYTQFYNSSMESIMERILNIDHGEFCLLIDKNNHPLTLDKTKSEYEEILNGLNLTYDFVFVYIRMENPLGNHKFFKSQFSHPLNFKIFVDSFIRMISRENVLMKDYSEAHNLEILVLFFSFFCNVKQMKYSNSQNIYLRMYDDSNKELSSLIEASLGQVIADYVIFQHRGAKFDELGYKKEDYTEYFLEIWEPFYQKNKDLLDAYSRPSVQFYENSIAEYEDVLLSIESKHAARKIFNFRYIRYFGIFFHIDIMSKFVQQKFADFHQLLRQKGFDDQRHSSIVLEETEMISRYGPLESDWNLTDYHLTILPVDGKTVAKEHQSLLFGFEKNKKLALKVNQCIYIPYKIVFFVVRSPMRKISLNKVPHIVIMLQENYSFSDCNEICERLIQANQLVFEGSDTKTTCESVEIDDLYNKGRKLEVMIFNFQAETIKGSQDIIRLP